MQRNLKSLQLKRLSLSNHERAQINISQFDQSCKQNSGALICGQLTLVGTSLSSISHGGSSLISLLCLGWHVVFREISESGVMSSWQVGVVGCLPALVFSFAQNHLQVVLNDQAASMILLWTHVHLLCHSVLSAFLLIIITLADV